ncbi:S8 family serine peptidase [Lysinibacillus sp. NPDC094177]|uniref:S8 family serine peptidase n=1 Tax=Lysinibacillus sp. NPDC094177 TaxID=3390580 RepID=UPI003D093757
MKNSIKIFLSSIIIASSMSSYSFAEASPPVQSFTGKGVKVAVIDSGVDRTHPDLKKNYLKGYDFVDNDNNPEDTEGHGTHVAGIIAANGSMKGIAPDASILAYRVFDDQKGGDTETIVKAIHQAIKDGAQIINLSLGESYKGTDSPLNKAVQEAIAKNITVIVAAGNAGPEQWTVNSLASTPEAITVGNIKQQGMSNTVLHIPGMQQDIEFHPLFEDQVLNPGKHTVAYLQNLNLDTIKKQNDLKNKIVIIDHIDEEQFEDSLQELQKRGVEAIFVPNEDSTETVEMTTHLYNTDTTNTTNNNAFPIPMSFNSKTEIEMLIKAAKEQKTVTIVQDTEARISSSSSNGPTVGSWQIKPDLAAPGTNIESTVPLNFEFNSPDVKPSEKEGYAIMSGTSMAAPYVAGAAALLKQAHPDWSPYEIRAALTSTTKLIKNRQGQVITPLAQGSGEINVEKALKAEILPLTNNLNFGLLHANTGTKNVVRKLRIENVSNYSRTLVTKNQLLEGKVELQIPNHITIPARQTIEVPVKLKVDTSLAIDKHIGMISLGQGEEQMNIPYMVSVDPKDYPYLSVEGKEEISFNKFPYVFEYYTPFSPKQLTISIKGYTADNQPLSSVLIEKKNPSKGYQQFKWYGKDKNKNTIPKGSYELVIVAKYNGQSYQVSQPLTIN